MERWCEIFADETGQVTVEYHEGAASGLAAGIRCSHTGLARFVILPRELYGSTFRVVN